MYKATAWLVPNVAALVAGLNTGFGADGRPGGGPFLSDVGVDGALSEYVLLKCRFWNCELLDSLLLSSEGEFHVCALLLATVPEVELPSSARR